MMYGKISDSIVDNLFSLKTTVLLFTVDYATCTNSVVNVDFSLMFDG